MISIENYKFTMIKYVQKNAKFSKIKVGKMIIVYPGSYGTKLGRS